MPTIWQFKIRVVATFNAGNKEICADLPHLHQTKYEVVAFQPGNPGSSAVGSFTIPLFPPGTEQYDAAKAIYDTLDYLQRVELSVGGKLYYAGIVTDIRKGYGANSVFELSGVSDIGIANLSKPFPGELLQVNYGQGPGVAGDYNQARHYFASNELGASDAFNPFTAGNYTSTNLPALTSGTWSGTTDDGLHVASCSTGTGAILISKTGAASASSFQEKYVEISGRLSPANDVNNGGGAGIGLSKSNSDATNSMVAWVKAKKSGSRFNFDVIVNNYAASVLTQTTVSNALTNVDDPEGFCPYTIGLLVGSGGISAVTVNGKSVMGPIATVVAGNDNIGSVTAYPFLMFATPATGSATCYSTNLVQMVKFSDDANTNVALFKPGTVGTSAHSLPINTDPGPTFLEVWSRAATREGWYWRYTPQAYVVGTRTLGTVDFTSDPGTDHGTDKSVVFSRDAGNLVDLQFSANADRFVSGTTLAGPPGTDGGGIAYWRDIGSMTKYGVVDDQILAVTAPNFSEQRRAALNVSNNRVNLSSAGSKTAVVLRDAYTADKWRELDKVMIHDPKLGINYLVARVIGYTFDEGQATQTLTLDQFSTDDPTIPMKRLQLGAFQMGAKFNTR